MIRPITAASDGFLGRSASASLTIASLGLLRRADDEPDIPGTTIGGPSGRSEGIADNRLFRFAVLWAGARAAGLS